ncbi:hypothetical protein BDV29DRAFT_185744 [Aspergillus leporis]|uniref:Uncharacterized protein n=1 Tax=Aspergillus leporis TaxID=41062 RepID=A0A5N5WGW5_9EURO|nr:hypothetical protein BDV29DRAFT_185744 [Aspergillus leporis]
MPLSRREHCVIDRVSCWASTPSTKALSLPLRPATIQLRPLPINNYHHHHQHPRQIHHLHKTVFANLHRTRDSVSCAPTSTPLHPTLSRAMSSDDAYMSFLDKANSDLNTARTQQTPDSSTIRTETVETGIRVPAPLKSVDAYYISETDEPFEPVALKWEAASKGVFPDPSHLSGLISPKADLSSAITTLSPSSFDPKNQYSSALRAVRAAAAEASGGDESAVEVKVYQVELGKSRVEYYVLALDVENSLVVGLRAKAIES